jgi:beta-xylosidase
VGLLVLVLPLLGIGAGPAQAATSPYARTLAVAGLADPVVYKATESLYFLSGTSSKNYLPIYRSTDLHTFSLLRRYDPNPLDRTFDYCNEWAPDLIKRGGSFYLYFTATRVAKGAACPSGNTQPTIFYATAPATSYAMAFGAPRMVNQNTAYPRTLVTAGCPPDGCDKALRLDPSVYFDGTRWWMHYTWFDPVAGPTVSAYPMDAPAQSFEVTRPTTPAEQGVNEAPDLFARNGQQYLMYSQGNYQGAYAMRYFMGARVPDLTRGHPLYTFSSPLKAHDGRLIENEGHNTVTTHNGQFFTLYHAARFSSSGAYAGRDVYLQRVMFHPDGTLHTLNTVTLNWTATANSTYVLDVLTRAGTWITGCMSAGAGSSVTYNEVCTGAGDRVVHKADVAAFRVNRSTGGTTVAGTKVAYDGYSDSLAVAV